MRRPSSHWPVTRGALAQSRQSVSRADSANCPLPRPIRAPKSVPDTVFPSRRAECHDTYPALVYLTDKVRVIECRDRRQWILQCRRSVCPNSWRGVSFCRTRESLLRCAGRGDPAATAWLPALPQRFPEARRFAFGLALCRQTERVRSLDLNDRSPRPMPATDIGVPRSVEARIAGNVLVGYDAMLGKLRSAIARLQSSGPIPPPIGFRPMLRVIEGRLSR